MDIQEPVSICTVSNPTEAELIRGALQAVGIQCTIGGESQAGFAGVLAIDVLVHASDVKEARKYLKQLRQEKLERKRARRDAKLAKKESQPDATSEAIQEIRPPLDNIQEPPAPQ